MQKIFFILLLPISLAAQKNYSESLEKYMQAITDVKGFSGAVMVVKQDKVLLKKGYGLKLIKLERSRRSGFSIADKKAK